MIITGEFDFKGANRFAMHPVIRLTFDPQSVEAMVPTELSQAVAARLAGLIPEFAVLLGKREQTSSTDVQGLSLADSVALTALALQRVFGYDVHATHLSQHDASGVIDAVYECRDSALGYLAGRAAVSLVDAAMAEETTASKQGSQSGLAELYTSLVANLQSKSLTKLTRWLVWECDRRGIPWSRVHPTENIVQLGQGHKQKRFFGSITSDTANISVILAGSKILVGNLFRSNGIPAPRQAYVADADAAVEAAFDIGLPVVIKPNYSDRGDGVSINLDDESIIREAFATAAEHGPVIVEEQIPGNDHRLTLIHGRIVAAGQNLPTQVAGDGRSTIQELIDAENRDPRRGERDYSVMAYIQMDEEILKILEEEGYDLDDVPGSGDVVVLRRWWRHAKDYRGLDLTDKVHPVNREMIERAARLIGLDVAGVDFITPDITRPWHKVGGAINEINPMPGLGTHMRAGAPDALGMLIETYFPRGENGRVPTVMVAGASSASRTTRLVADILDSAGHVVGLATEEGVEIGGSTVTYGDFAGAQGAYIALNDPTTTAAVLQTSGASIAREGLGIDRVSVGAVIEQATNGEPQGTEGASNAPASDASLLVEVATELVVLDAASPQATYLADKSKAKDLCWVTRDPGLLLFANHVDAGGVGLGITEAGGEPKITLWHQGRPTPLVPVDRVKPESDSTCDSTLVDAMFAAAIAYGLGIPFDAIGKGLVGAGTKFKRACPTDK